MTDRIIKYFDINRGTYCFYDEGGNTIVFDDIVDYLKAVNNQENYGCFNQTIIDLFDEAKREDLESEKKRNDQLNDYYDNLDKYVKERGWGIGIMITPPEYDDDDNMVINPEFDFFPLNSDDPSKELRELFESESYRKVDDEDKYEISDN
jgi:hypothetical protein